jgi:hypothetical protein
MWTPRCFHCQLYEMQNSKNHLHCFLHASGVSLYCCSAFPFVLVAHLVLVHQNYLASNSPFSSSADWHFIRDVAAFFIVVCWLLSGKVAKFDIYICSYLGYYGACTSSQFDICCILPNQLKYHVWYIYMHQSFATTTSSVLVLAVDTICWLLESRADKFVPSFLCWMNALSR